MGYSRDGSLLPSIYADTRCVDAVVVSKVREKAFSGCTSLSILEIPSTVRSLGGSVLGTFKGAFSQCTSLKVLLVQPICTGDGDGGAAPVPAHVPVPVPAPGVVPAASGMPSKASYPPPKHCTAPVAVHAGTTSAIVKAFNDQRQFQAVNRIWAGRNLSPLSNRESARER